MAVIIGAGQAGANAAMAMRAAGFAGRVVLLGDEAWHPYERPPLSKQALTEDPAPEPGWFFPAARYAERGIELLLGTRAEGIDPTAARVQLGNGERLPYDRLLLATGGRARGLAVPGGDAALTLRTLDDARAIRARLVPGARVVCIGAGVIGLEIAASASARGCAVTVLEAAQGVMGRCLTPDLAAWMERLHRDAGVTLHLGAAVAAIEGGHVLCADGLAVPADLVVAGIGIARDAALFPGEADNGIPVDEYGRTAVANVFAAGDLAAFWHPTLRRRLRLESWRHAQDHGIAVGRNMADVETAYAEIPWFWSDQHGVNLQVAGLPQHAMRTVLRGEATAASFAAFHLDAQGRVVGATGINAPREVRAATALIRAARAVDEAALADPATNLQKLARG